MKTTTAAIQATSILSQPALDRFLALLERVERPRATVLIRAGRVEPFLYFIESGLARAYVDGDSQQINIWFGKEGDVVLSFNSYIHQKAGYETIELVEDAVLYRVRVADLQALYQTNLEIANWGRKFAEKELVKTEERFICRQFKTAKARYLELIADSPELLKRMPLGHIASYLGVSQVTVSRIRAAVR